jgi:putative NADPH-quinone reductase
LLKGFLEQLLRPGIAFSYPEKGFTPKTLLAGRSARVIVTMGMPALAYRFFFFAHSVRSLKRNILRFVGFSPVRDTVFGMVANADQAKVRSWLEKMKALGAKAA